MPLGCIYVQILHAGPNVTVIDTKIYIMVITVTNGIIEGIPISKLKLNIYLIHKSQTIIDHATKPYLAIERTLS